MKNNFKKSKFVILPALATLVLTGVASVTGTVAWFTANRAVTAAAGNFEARGLNGDFKIKATAGVGTTTSDTDNTTSTVTVSENTLMADASYDIYSDVLYTKVLGEGENGAAAVTGFKVIGTNGKYANLDANNLKAGSVTESSTAKTVYYALTWKYTFTYTFTDTTKKIDLFLDSENSSFKSSNDTALDDTNGTGKGFRVGFIGEKKTILSADTETTHVTGTGLSNVAIDYNKETNVHYLTAGLTNEKATDGTAENTNRADYLGTFEPTTKTTIDLNVIAWFEGTDTHVVNDNTIEAVKGSFNFYVREGDTVTQD